MCFNQIGDISTLNGSSLKRVDKFTDLGKQCLIDRDKHRHATKKGMDSYNMLSVIWKSDLTYEIKRSFFQTAVESILPLDELHGRKLEKSLDENYTRMLQAILNMSRRQHPTKQQLYDQQPHITKTIQIRRTRHAVHCCRSRDELISDVLQWTPTQSRAWTYIQQPCEDMGCSPEDQPEAMNDREGWRERIRDTHADGRTRWWRWWWKLATVVDGDPKASFLIPTTWRGRKSAIPFRGSFHFTLDPYLIMPSVKQGDI